MSLAANASRVTLRNSHLEATIDTARGATITHFSRRGGNNVLFAADWATPVPAAESISYGDATLDWLSEYRGGWHGLLPNAGSAGIVDGVPIPFHGELAAARWTVDELTESRVSLSAGCRLPFVATRTITLSEDAASLMVHEPVQNVGEDECPLLWGHHPALDASGGGSVDLPAASVSVSPTWRPRRGDLVPGSSGSWPNVDASAGPVDLRVIPLVPTERLCFLHDLSEHWAAYRPIIGDGVALAWDGAVLPHAWLWVQIYGSGFPWFGRPTIVAIEPHSAPDDQGLEWHSANGSALTLTPSEIKSLWLSATLFPTGPEPVIGVSRQGVVQRSLPQT